MSLCDGASNLLKSYGSFEEDNTSDTNYSFVTSNPVFKHWCYYDSVPAVAHYLVGTLLLFICVLSITGNLLVIVVFTRYRRLRSPANTLIINLATSDMLNGFLHPMAAYSSFREHWMFGRLGCEIYAGLCGLFGLVSIVTLTAIAIERCLVISVKPWYGGTLFTQDKAKISIVIIWIYCFLVMIPPVFGWGAFVPEGFLTSCSFDYITRSPSNRSYFFYIFVLGFFLPVTIITVCYAFIIRTIFRNEKDMKKNNIKKVHNKLKKRNDYKAAEMIMFVIGMFLVSWIPYSVIATIGQFGNRSILTPWLSVLPSLFAKMSTIYNPAIYGLSHRHFRATLRRIFKREHKSSERGGTYFSKNSTYTRTKHGCTCMPNYVQSDIYDESSSSFTGKQIYLGVTVANTVDNNRIIYVKKRHSIQKSCTCNTPYISERRLRRDVRFSTDNTSGQSSSITHKRPTVINMKYDPAKISLIRSMMFKSESSIYQKYQIYLEKDHIVKIPSAICPFPNVSKNETSIFPPPESTYDNNSQYVKVSNLDYMPMQNLIQNVLRTSSKQIENIPCQKMFKECFCKDCVTNNKFSP